MPVTIRLDIPYSAGADKMRAAFIVAQPFESKRTGPVANIPEALVQIETLAGADRLNSSTTLVYAHDDRHDLAWTVKEEADRRGWQFARHVPDILQIPPGEETAYESFETGSPEDVLPPREAQVLVMQLGEQGREYFGTGMDLLPAMNVMRHALWLCLRHFGWQSPGTALTLRNFGYVLRATGNQDNMDEFIYLMRRLQFVWKSTPPVKADWAQSAVIVDQLAELLQAMGEPSDSLKLPD